MSLTSFLDMRDVNDKVKLLRPKLPRKITAALQAEPRSNRYSMVGTAFDYLLRFDLQRRAPHAISEQWVAEHASGIIWKTVKGAVSFMHLSKETAGRAHAVVDKAKSAVTAYVKNKSPTLPEQADLASHAIRLAKLDVMYRALQLDDSFEEAAKEDVEDLLAMLAIVPLYVQKYREFVSNTACRFGGAATERKALESTAAGRSIVPRRSPRRREAGSSAVECT